MTAVGTPGAPDPLEAAGILCADQHDVLSVAADDSSVVDGKTVARHILRTQNGIPAPALEDALHENVPFFLFYGLRDVDPEVEAVAPVEGIPCPRKCGVPFFSVGVVPDEVESDRGRTGKIQRFPGNGHCCGVVRSGIPDGVREFAEIQIPAPGELLRKTVCRLRRKKQTVDMSRIRIPFEVVRRTGIEEGVRCSLPPRGC